MSLLLFLTSSLLFSCLDSLTEAHSTLLPRRVFTDKEIAVKRWPVPGNHAPVRILLRGEPDSVTAAGQTHLYTYDFQQPQKAPVRISVAALLVPQLPLVSSDPNCNVTQQPDGSIMYKLSQPHASSCDISWEDVHNIVIARNSETNKTLVQALNNQSITMKNCSGFLLYRVECSGVQVMTKCSVNCTRLSEQSPEIPSVNSDLIGSSVDRSVKRERFGLCVSAVFAVIAVVVCLCIYKPRCVRTAETVSYSAPSETVNLNQ